MAPPLFWRHHVPTHPAAGRAAKAAVHAATWAAAAETSAAHRKISDASDSDRPPADGSSRQPRKLAASTRRGASTSQCWEGQGEHNHADDGA